MIAPKKHHFLNIIKILTINFQLTIVLILYIYQHRQFIIDIILTHHFLKHNKTMHSFLKYLKYKLRASF